MGRSSRNCHRCSRGAGWNVIKVLWGSKWDELFARDTEQALIKRFVRTVDGEFQTLGAKDGTYNLKTFFESDPALHKLVAHLSPEEIGELNRGGHDLKKLYAAFAAARALPRAAHGPFSPRPRRATGWARRVSRA